MFIFFIYIDSSISVLIRNCSSQHLLLMASLVFAETIEFRGLCRIVSCGGRCCSRRRPRRAASAGLDTKVDNLASSPSASATPRGQSRNCVHSCSASIKESIYRETQIYNGSHKQNKYRDKYSKSNRRNKLNVSMQFLCLYEHMLQDWASRRKCH